MLSKKKLSNIYATLIILSLAYLCGQCAGMLMGMRSSDPVSETSSNAYPSLSNESQNWGLGFEEDGTRPTGTSSIEELAPYNAYYAENTADKVLYLTFDAGYENGNTPAILDALNKHHAPATFFAVGPYIKEHPELVQRMVSEGHTVGNHSWSHPDMTGLTQKAFEEELTKVEEIYHDVTGQQMTKFYRPPMGKYSKETLTMAKNLGYHTFFWSLAYVDWEQDNQPTKEEALAKLLPRIHPGAIILLHSTSSTNAEIMDELLTKLEEMGYQFKSLSEFVSQNEPKT